jgi:hypothetical protein
MGYLKALSLPNISPFDVVLGYPLKSAFQFAITEEIPITPYTL